MSPVNSGDTLAIKNFKEIALSRIVSACVFVFMQKFKMATKDGGKMNFGKSHQLTLLIPFMGVKNLDQIGMFHTVSQINVFLCFTQKFKMAAKNSRKMIFGKTRQWTLWHILALKSFNEITLSCTVFEIFTLFYFPLKSKMATIRCEN